MHFLHVKWLEYLIFVATRILIQPEIFWEFDVKGNFLGDQWW